VIITLFHVEDLSYEQISAIMQLPVGTVKSRLNRARLALRNVIEASGDMDSIA
jgi:RNA polymerase sigma-70 factor (ECF subfamily)